MINLEPLRNTKFNRNPLSSFGDKTSRQTDRRRHNVLNLFASRKERTKR